MILSFEWFVLKVYLLQLCNKIMLDKGSFIMTEQIDNVDTCCKETCCANGCCSDGCKTGECSSNCCSDGCCSDTVNCCSE